MGDLTLMGESPFDAIRRTDEHGEYWTGRDLQPVMKYSRWEDFASVIWKARASLALVQGEEQAAHHFGESRSDGGRWGNQQIADFRLTRFGAYLTAMAGDHSNPAVAEARIYFAVKTREAETRPTTTVVVSEISRRELAAMVIAEADRADAAEQRARELEPAAQSWEALAEASGDYSMREAAQILDRDPEIRTGQNRLARHLKNIGWVSKDGTPYQRHVDAGRLLLRMYTDRQDVLRRQIRITAKGLADLHREMGGTGPLMTVVAS